MDIKKISKPISDTKEINGSDDSVNGAKKPDIIKRNTNKEVTKNIDAINVSNKENAEQKNTDAKKVEKKNDMKKDGEEKEKINKDRKEAPTLIKGKDGGPTAEHVEQKNKNKKDVKKKNTKKERIKFFLKKIFKRRNSNSESELKKEKKKKSLLNLDLKDINLKNIKIGNTFSKLSRFWFKHYRIVFIILFAFAVLGGGYIWYESLYLSQWNEDQKNQYIISQKREVNFKDDQFQAIIKDINERRVMYESEHEELKDIFKIQN